MKGLLLKDFYMARSLLVFLGVVFLVLGVSFSYLVSPWAMTVIATVMMGVNVTSSIQADQTSGWLKTVLTTPASRKTLLNSKYVLYLLFSLAGLLLGLLVGAIAALALDAGREMLVLFLWISVSMALFSGGMLLPLSFCLEEGGSMVGNILAYPLSAGLYVGLVLLLGDRPWTCPVIALLAAAVFALSWLVSQKILARKEL